jgi:prepilin-type N-terminal cleavage/methylation domain-containing protein
MIARLRQRLRHDDAGMTLVEVIIAMVIFAMVSTGFVYTMLSVLQLTRDSRAREVAANLAAEEVDLARDAADLFALVDDDWSIDMNGETFHVARRTSWVTNPDEAFSCGGAGVTGGAGGNLRYKRVNVTVTWDGMRESTEAVRSDTLINPAERVNDPTLGTIIVSVLNGGGTGSSGVAVTTDPAVPAVVKSTDSQGCTYVLKVAPKQYKISLARSGYVDNNQLAIPSQTVEVVAGQTTTVGFQYDRAATFTAKLAPLTGTPAGTPAPKIPVNLTTTFTNTYGDFARNPDGGASTATQTFRLHPFSSGYTAYAGSCVAADPTQWPPQTVGLDTWAGQRPEPQAALGGGVATLEVPMGLVTVTGGGGSFLRATSVDPVASSDAPKCTAVQTLDYGSVLGAGPTTIALPYGTWELTRGTSQSGASTPISAPNVTPLLPAGDRTTISGSRITLDPRTVTVAP